MAYADSRAGDNISIGNVLSNTFNVIANNPASTLGVAFVIGVLPPELLSFALVGGARVGANLFSSTGGIALYLGIVVVSVFFALLVQASIMRATIAHSRGERASIGASLAGSMSKVLPLLGLTILLTVAVMLGFVALIVPGIILAIMWCVSAPALVAEDVGITGAMSRSQELTKGHRWKIFALFVVLIILLWIMSAIAGLAMLLSGGVESLAQDLSSGALPIGYMIVSAVTNTLFTAFWTTLVASLYLALRTAKEGPLTDRLADVFA